MIFEYPFALNALLLCLILTGMHTYLGYHIVKRGVIFVDLSLAQISALGGCVAILFGYSAEESGRINYALSLGATLIGAALFAFFRSKKQKIPVEALIGVCYAGAGALSLLILEKSASGTEDVKNMLTGSILTVSLNETAVIVILYSFIGALHFIFRKQFMLITDNPQKAQDLKMNVRLWDIFFYATFGLVVTSSVKAAGVLTVFAFLVIPSVNASLFTQEPFKKIWLGWGIGFAGVILGLEMSLRFNYAAAPSVIAAFIAFLILSWIILKLKENCGLFLSCKK
jgi:zinc/manganese transport system permease protein